MWKHLMDDKPAQGVDDSTLGVLERLGWGWLCIQVLAFASRLFRAEYLISCRPQHHDIATVGLQRNVAPQLLRNL